MAELLKLILGMTLRFALPVGLTIAMGWILNRLDERWRLESLQESLSKLTAPGRPISSVPCWEANDCPPDRRSACSAYKNADTPCWEAVSPKGHLQEACRRCALRTLKLAAAS